MYRVVLVDDEPWALSGLEELIDWETLGFTIVGKYTDPEEAIEQIGRTKPDVIITDVRMPKLSGIDLISKLQHFNDDAEFILISAYRDFEAVRKALKYGAFQYILKPFCQEEVEETIHLLSEKLEGVKKEIIIDPKDSENLKAPQTERFLNEAAPYPFCTILLLDHPEQHMLQPQSIQFTLANIAGHPTAYLLSGQSMEGLFNYISQVKISPLNGASFSRVHPSFSELDQMLEEAQYALENGFCWSPNPLASNIQLYICKSELRVSLSDITSVFFLTEAYISGMFKKNTGSTITGFIQDIHIYRAARLLLRTDLGLQELAEKLGFMDYSYFGRLFKRRFGTSPASYRRSLNASRKPSKAQYK